MPAENSGTPVLEQTTRALGTFFSVLIGLAIKNIVAVTATSSDPPEVQQFARDRWYYFVISIFLFLRFLLGSTNHLWLTYVKDNTRNAKKRNISADLCFLIWFGCWAVSISTSNRLDDFLSRNLWLLSGAAVATTFFLGGEWGFWFPINLAQIGAVWLVLDWHPVLSFPPLEFQSFGIEFHLHARLLLLAVLYFGFLLIDFWLQLHNLLKRNARLPAVPPVPSPAGLRGRAQTAGEVT